MFKVKFDNNLYDSCVKTSFLDVISEFLHIYGNFY